MASAIDHAASASASKFRPADTSTCTFFWVGALKPDPLKQDQGTGRGTLTGKLEKLVIDVGSVSDLASSRGTLSGKLEKLVIDVGSVSDTGMGRASISGELEYMGE